MHLSKPQFPIGNMNWNKQAAQEKYKLSVSGNPAFPLEGNREIKNMKIEAVV